MTKKPPLLTKTECSCARCQGACDNVPGWFRPGEAEKAAKLLRLTLPVFFKRYLGVNWWVGSPDVFVLAPAIVTMKPGTEYPGNPKGRCVFFKKGRCQIHAAKPYECAYGNPCEPDLNHTAHEARELGTVPLWRKNQRQIRELLGRQPQAAAFDIFDMIGGMF